MSQKLKDIADDLRQIATEIDNELTVKPLDVKRGNVTLAEAMRLVGEKLPNHHHNVSMQVDKYSLTIGPVVKWSIWDGEKQKHTMADSLDKALSLFLGEYEPATPTDLDAVTEIIDGVKPEKEPEPVF